MLLVRVSALPVRAHAERQAAVLPMCLASKGATMSDTPNPVAPDTEPTPAEEHKPRELRWGDPGTWDQIDPSLEWDGLNPILSNPKDIE
jgi:hypothetical protein